MSHELRSPLNAILGFAQLMASDSLPPNPTQQASIDQILKAGWHLLELINEVLDLAKIEAGQASLSPEPVSLAEALRECHAMVEQQTLKRGVRMRFPSFDFPCFVRADRTRLKQILLNLLSNAIKYRNPDRLVAVLNENSPTLTVRLTRPAAREPDKPQNFSLTKEPLGSRSDQRDAVTPFTSPRR